MNLLPDTPTLWFLIVALGVGTFLIRFSFLGLIGSRRMPAWVLRHLRYTPVAVLPALVTPPILWPQATGGDPDPARLAAAAMTLAVGLATKNVLLSITAGAATLYSVMWLLG